MTEAEARMKWCPMVRYHVLPDGEQCINRDIVHDLDEELDAKCIGSACMMWRGIRNFPYEDHGYCGLAGKP